MIRQLEHETIIRALQDVREHFLLSLLSTAKFMKIIRSLVRWVRLVTQSSESRSSTRIHLSHYKSVMYVHRRNTRNSNLILWGKVFLVCSTLLDSLHMDIILVDFRYTFIACIEKIDSSTCYNAVICLCSLSCVINTSYHTWKRRYEVFQLFSQL